jgi:hypothetical protein
VNGIIESDRRGKYNGIKVKDFIAGETYTCSRLCNYTGRDSDVGKTGRFMIYKSTICEIEVDGQKRISYEGSIKYNNSIKAICIGSFVMGIIFMLLALRFS